MDLVISKVRLTRGDWPQGKVQIVTYVKNICTGSTRQIINGHYPNYEMAVENPGRESNYEMAVENPGRESGDTIRISCKPDRLTKRRTPPHESS